MSLMSPLSLWSLVWPKPPADDATGGTVFTRKPYYSPTDLARELGVSHDKILDMIHAGDLFAVKLGPRTYRVPLGAALATFAPHEVLPGERVVLPSGSGNRLFESLERAESEQAPASQAAAAQASA